jgi:Predicted metal-dependent hydrolase
VRWGVPVELVEASALQWLAVVDWTSSDLRSAVAMAGEHLLGEIGNAILSRPELLDGVDPRIVRLFRWHGYEEVEHKEEPRWRLPTRMHSTQLGSKQVSILLSAVNHPIDAHLPGQRLVEDQVVRVRKVTGARPAGGDRVEASRSDERIDEPQAGDARESLIVGPELGGAVLEDGERDLQVEDPCAGDLQIGRELEEPHLEPRSRCPDLHGRVGP